MKKRHLFASGVVVLAILGALLIWQGSFSFGDLSPATLAQTYVYWGIFTLVFLLTLTLAFMLFRIGLKLYIERQSNREGSRIRTKLIIGALGLCSLPTVFLVLWSINLLNYNLLAWFSRPAQNERWDWVQVGQALDKEADTRVKFQANWLASLPEIRAAADGPPPGNGAFDRLCQENDVERVWIERPGQPDRPLCVPAKPNAVKTVEGRAAMNGSTLVIWSRIPLDFAEKQKEIARHVAEYEQHFKQRKDFRNLYILLLFLITLFIIYVAYWVAQFFSKQIVDPILAILEAASEIRRGNLSYRVRTSAIDELATLVRTFNEMTRDLDANGRELERRRRFTEAILESIPTGVISLAADGKILRYNQALTKILPKEQVEQANRLDDLFSRDDAAEIRYLMKRARRTGVASRQMDMQRGKETVHLSVTVSALEEKTNSGFVIILEDTGDLLKAQKVAAWHEVARRIAHEIKNPLTPISLCAERIVRQLDRAAVPQDTSRILRECSATITEEVESVKTLVNEFSQFARFPAAQLAPGDLNEVVDSALAVFHGRVDGIQIVRHLAPGLPVLMLDREQLKRAVVNLVDNAAEAMQDALVKRLVVTTHSVSQDTVELTIADTGCGISAEDKEKLFLPYFSTKGRGTGLGLAIVSQIVTDHHAQIRVENNQPTGARFIIELPVPWGADAEDRDITAPLAAKAETSR